MPHDTNDQRTQRTRERVPLFNKKLDELDFREKNLDDETLRFKKERIEEAVKSRSIEQLRILCAEVGGLLTCDLRRQAWPIFLLIDEEPLKKNGNNSTLNADNNSKREVPRTHAQRQPFNANIQKELNFKSEKSAYHHTTSSSPQGKNRFHTQIKHDVDRSYVLLEVLHDNKKRGSYRSRLMRLIDSIFDEFDFLNYYQGFHDIACILILILESPEDIDDELPRKVLKVLSLTLLRDHLTSTLHGTLDHLYILSCLLSYCNPALLEKMNHMHMNAPIFALSWITTWFSHDVLDSISREDLVREDPVHIAENTSTPMQYKIRKNKIKKIWNMLNTLFRLFDYIISQRSYAPIYLAAAVSRLKLFDNPVVDRKSISEDFDLDSLSTRGLHLIKSPRFSDRLFNSDDPDSEDFELSQQNDYASLHTYISSLVNWRYVNDVEHLIQESITISRIYPVNYIVRLYNYKNFHRIVANTTLDDFRISHSNHVRTVLLSESSCIYNIGWSKNTHLLLERKLENIGPREFTVALSYLLSAVETLAKLPLQPFKFLLRPLCPNESSQSHNHVLIPDTNWHRLPSWDVGMRCNMTQARELTEAFVCDLEIKKSYMSRGNLSHVLTESFRRRSVIQLVKILSVTVCIGLITGIASLISYGTSKLWDLIFLHKKKLSISMALFTLFALFGRLFKKANSNA